MYCKFDELAELDCKLDELTKLRMSSMSDFCSKIIWSIEIHGESVGYILHTPCLAIYCLRLIDVYYENYSAILCVIAYCIGMCLRQNLGHGV